MSFRVKSHGACIPGCFKSNKKKEQEALITYDNKNFFPIEFNNQTLIKNASLNLKKQRILAKILKENEADDLVKPEGEQREEDN